MKEYRKIRHTFINNNDRANPMTSKEANVDFVNKLKRLGTLTSKQALKENKTYGQVDTFRSIQTYGERNQGIQDRVANNYGTSLFPFSRTITNSHFSTLLCFYHWARKK